MPASGQAADPSTSNIQAIFEVAFDEYGTHTGQDLKKHPFAADFECCNSPDAALDIIRKQARVLDESNGGKLLRSLSPVVHILSGFSETLGEGIGLTFGPAKVIFTGIAVLLEAVKDVAASRDALVQLFERIELFLLRLKLHTKISLTDTMAKILGKFMAHILSVLVLSTEEMKRPLIAKSFKMLIGRKDIDDALHRLDILTIEEIAAMMARNLDEVVQVNSTLLKGKIKDWLNPPDYSINHHTAREKQHEGTTKWFIGDSRFTGWKAKGSLLWICGNPGSGKSVLCSAIIENVKQTQGDSSLIAFHYFDHGDDTKHNLRGLLSSLVFQLAVSSNRCWGVLRALHSQCRDGFERPSDADLTRCLKSMVQYPRQLPIYLLIDALDECPNTPGPSARENVLKFLKDLISLNQSNLFICITSRPEHDIRTVLDHLTPPFRRVLLHEEGGQTDDINSFIRSFVELHCNMEGWRKEDKELVIKVLSNRAHGMFQWVWCQLDTVRWCLRADLHDALNNLPTTLDVTYEQALRGIPTIQQPHAHRLFQCLLVALRPLRVQELAEVFKVKFEDTASNLMEDYRHENPEKAVLSTCSTLVTIVGSEDSRVVQFSHFSVKEFLTSHRLRTHGVENIRYYYIPRDFAHSILARVCLTVLLQFNENVDKGLLEKFPLALYAGQNWVDHAKEKDVASRIQDAMKSLFTPDKPYLAAWVWIHDVDMGQIRESTSSLAERPTPPEATALYYAVLCGFSVLAKYLIDTHGEDVNAKCGRHGSPLHAASYEGHLEAVRVLLRHHADPNTKNRYKRTPLYVAFDLKRYEIMRLLLKHRANPNMSYDLDEHLLHRVSGLGDVDVGQLLLKHDADVNARDSSDWTPLHWASTSGHRKFVKLLLEYRANVDARSKTQVTPLHLASEHGHVDVVRLLLESGANVNPSSPVTQMTPLHFASKHGNSEVVRLLLASGAHVNALYKAQITALRLASEYGHPEVVSLLLEYGANSNAPPVPQPPEPQLPFNPTREDYRPWMPTPQPFSLFTGKRRALIIGIDYASHPDPDFRLQRCVEDAFTMANFLYENLGFKRDDIRIITDKNPLDPPTKANILDAMRELVRDAKPHDSFFLYLSGHSMQIEDMNGDDQDGLDECICAVDWRGIGQPPFEDTPGLITGDVMHDILVGPLPLRCRLTAVFDACHSGTVLDLPYVYSSKGEVKHPNKLGLLWEEARYADVVSLSANHDSRKASETRKGGDLRLAFINCFITLGYHVTYKQLIDNVSEFMWDNGCKQKPVLSSSHEIGTDRLFIV